LKIFFDEEALVTQVSDSKYTCLMADGNTFRTRRIEENVKNKIQINDVISYKHLKTSPNGKPIQPRIYRIRRDLDWKDVLANWVKYSPNKKPVKRNWRDLREQRKFFDFFATTKKFNPLDAEKWYSLPYNEISRAVSIP